MEGGWNGLSADPEFGGQGLPFTLTAVLQEGLHGGCMGFGIGPTLTLGAVHALEKHGSDEQKRLYLPKLVTGEWAATMNLTESQAGSDVGALRTKAEPAGDGTYRIKGQKIFITYGDHDLTDNIIHLVLARTPGAPEGTRGISLFLVPKFLVNQDGSLGARNDAFATGIEHKLGLHGSPTCTMAYGDKGECVGYLIGEERRGMAAMFTMMNTARLDVGLQGVGIAERAFQQALAYAQERRQGRPFEKRHEAGEPVPIIQHPDVRRMLYLMKAKIEAARAICYANAVAVDLAHRGSDEAARKAAKGREELLTPISKAWSTDMGIEATSIGVQIHGGMGYVEETGAAQHYRDSRIAAIYEGTNGIQAIDLVTRKLPMQGGEVAGAFFDEVDATAGELKDHSDSRLSAIGARLDAGAASLRETSQWLRAALQRDVNDALAGATAYLAQFGTVAGGFYLARGAAAAAEAIAKSGDDSYLEGKIALARFYADHVLSAAPGLAGAVAAGAEALPEIAPEVLSGS
ncbi:MAG: acyl-CoA dehydrogenase [Parvularculaceae bacterium]